MTRLDLASTRLVHQIGARCEQKNPHTLSKVRVDPERAQSVEVPVRMPLEYVRHGGHLPGVRVRVETDSVPGLSCLVPAPRLVQRGWGLFGIRYKPPAETGAPRGGRRHRDRLISTLVPGVSPRSAALPAGSSST